MKTCDVAQKGGTMITVGASGVIRLTRGDTARLEVSVNSQDGEPYEIRADDTVTLTVRRTANDPTIQMQKTVVGSGSFYIAPKDTQHMQFQKYVYDIQITTGAGDVYTVIPPSTFEVMEEVTW